jgi:hypothetical protein
VKKTYLKKNVDNENVENIFERVDNTVEHSLEFGHSLDGLEWTEYAKYAQGFDCTQVLTRRAPTASQD